MDVAATLTSILHTMQLQYHLMQEEAMQRAREREERGKGDLNRSNAQDKGFVVNYLTSILRSILPPQLGSVVTKGRMLVGGLNDSEAALRRLRRPKREEEEEPQAVASAAPQGPVVSATKQAVASAAPQGPTPSVTSATKTATSIAQPATINAPKIPGSTPTNPDPFGKAIGEAIEPAAKGGGMLSGAVEGMAGLVEGLETTALAIPGLGEAVIVVTAAFEGIKLVLYDLPKALYDWTKSLLESQRASARYSPDLNRTFARMQSREINREREYGRQTGGTTEMLGNALADFQDELVPLRALITNLLNLLGTGILKTLNAILTVLNKSIGFEAGKPNGDLVEGVAREGAMLWAEHQRMYGPKVNGPMPDPFRAGGFR